MHLQVLLALPLLASVQAFWSPVKMITVQKEQGVRLVSLMQREIILYMASAICVSSYLADFYLYLNLRHWNKL
jgi:hypothetical protein